MLADASLENLMNRQQEQTLDLSQVFESVVGQLRNDRSELNALDQAGGNGNHGDNIVTNFEMVANALRGQSGQDAGTQLRQAADVLQNNGRGSTAGLYAQGLREAAQQVQGRQGEEPRPRQERGVAAAQARRARQLRGVGGCGGGDRGAGHHAPS